MHEPPFQRLSPGTRHNARRGMMLFIIYFVVYAVFVGLAAFSPTDIMARPVVGGVNLAIVYGFGLIIGAFVLAIIYMMLCKPTDEQDGK